MSKNDGSGCGCLATIILVGYLVCSHYIDGSNSKKEAEETSRYDSSLVEYEMPKSVFFIKHPYNTGATAPFKVNVPRYSSFVVRLRDYESGALVLEYFIPAGRSSEIEIPIGTYKLSYTSGNRWYGTKELFGRGASFGASDEKLVFTYGEGHEITLRKVAHGNFRTGEINYSEF